jgi:triacylglycerol lipase
MQPLAKQLAEAGFAVHNLSYASTEKAPEALVAEVGEKIEACCREAEKLNFVGHSLGGILIRAYLAKEPPVNAGRVVMLAPPNGGSEIVDSLGGTAIFGAIMGPSAQQLGTDPESFPNRLPAPTVEVGVIAGTDSVNPAGSVLIPDEDDGMVSLANTKLDGMTDFLVLPISHAFIMRSEEVGEQVIRFLDTGRFRHEAIE